MERKTTLIWIYMGRNPGERLDSIGEIDGTRLEVLAVGNAEVKKAAEMYALSHAHCCLKTLDRVSLDAIWEAVSPESETLVFWIDDEKVVHRTFPLDMAAPLTVPDEAAGAGDRHLHYWDGNALAVSRSAAESLAVRDLKLRDDSLLTMLSDVIDRGVHLRDGKLKVMFSPLERFAAIEGQPLGLAS